MCEAGVACLGGGLGAVSADNSIKLPDAQLCFWGDGERQAQAGVCRSLLAQRSIRDAGGHRLGAPNLPTKAAAKNDAKKN